MKYQGEKTTGANKKTFYVLCSTFCDNRGYSLVELMVAVTLFTLVAMASISALISINDASKKAQTMRAILDNLNFAAENMARNLRVGTNYYCGESLTPQPPLDCSLSGGSAISFSDYEGRWIVYRFNSTKKNIERFIGGVGPLPLTPENPVGSLPEENPLSVDNLRFYVSGSGPSDGKQPRVVIVLDGTAKHSNKIQTTFELQTSVSGRQIDL